MWIWFCRVANTNKPVWIFGVVAKVESKLSHHWKMGGQGIPLYIILKKVIIFAFLFKLILIKDWYSPFRRGENKSKLSANWWSKPLPVGAIFLMMEQSTASDGNDRWNAD